MTARGAGPSRSPRRAIGVLRALALGAAVACGTSGDERSGAGATPSAGCRPGASPRIGALRARIDVGGVTRSYLLDVPAGPTDEPRPVVIGFHGFGGTALRFRRHSHLGALALRQGVIAVFPDGRDGIERRGRVGRGWDVGPEKGPDAELVEAVLAELARTRCIDERRIFVVGVSNGGLLANRLGCAMAGRLAGVAAVAGSAPLDDCAGRDPVAVMLVHGRKDVLVPIREAREARDWWKRRNGCGDAERDGDCERYQGCRLGPVAWCETDEGHDWPRRTARRIWKFFKSLPERNS